MGQTITVNALSLRDVRSYLLAALFIAANILLPQLFHVFNLSGIAFLPIILFTLIGTMLYGRTVGVMTAIASPLISFLVFSMPDASMTAVIIAKGLTIALVLGYFVAKSSKINLSNIVLSIAAYQVVGFISAAAILSVSAAIEGMVSSYPAVIMQLVAGYSIIKIVSLKQK